MKAKKRKEMKLSTAKKRAWRAFSIYIRTKSLDGSLLECYTCGHKFPMNTRGMSAGHGIGGRTNSVLFMEEVVRPQCYACNVLARGRYKVFTSKLVDEMGAEKYDELLKQARQTIHYSVQDYLDIEAKYKSKLEELS